MKCIFVLTVDPFINVARVQIRVASGGHDLDREKIVNRYYKSLDTIKSCFRFVIYCKFMIIP